MNKAMQLVIPMTGVGQRFVNRGYSDIKPLIQTGMGSMLAGVLRNFQSITSPICVVSESHPQKSRLKAEIVRLRPQARIVEIEAHKKGPSFAVWRAKEYLNPELPTIVNYCDFSGVWSENELIKNLTLQDGLILTYQGFHPHRFRSNAFAYVKKDINGIVTEVQEKRSFTDDPSKEEASSGTYGFKTARIMLSAIQTQLDQNISHNEEFYTSLTYIPMIREGLEVKTMLIDKFFQWGTPDDLEDFIFWSELAKKKKNPEFPSEFTSALILAAGSGTRLAQFTDTPKPLIKAFGKPLWEYSGELIDSCLNKSILIRSQDQAQYVSANYPNISKLTVNSATNSQAESAKKGLQMLKPNDSPVHVLAADNIMQELKISDVTENLKASDLVVWVTKNYSIAKFHPAHFTWVDIDEMNQITKVYFKESIPNEESFSILGNFTFKSLQMAEKVIEEVISQSLSSTETYLDHVIEYCLKKNLKVAAFIVNKSFSIGTEEEWLTLNYWQESFTALGKLE
jgi:dTDP-glucose pyrophosphorylase